MRDVIIQLQVVPNEHGNAQIFGLGRSGKTYQMLINSEGKYYWKDICNNPGE